MRLRYLITVLFAGLLCVPFSVFAKSKPEALPPLQQACVGCGFKHGCASCVGGGTAVYCETFNCGACEEDGYCVPGTTRASLAVSDSSGKLRQIRLSEKVIRQISALHPRFAITLAEMNVYGFSPGKRRVYWTPVELTSSDVEAFLHKGTHASFFDDYDEKARALNRLIQAGELSRIVYAISIENTDTAWSIKVEVQGDLTAVDPTFSTLEIQVKTSKATQTLGQSSRNKERWQIR